MAGVVGLPTYRRRVASCSRTSTRRIYSHILHQGRPMSDAPATGWTGAQQAFEYQSPRSALCILGLRSTSGEREGLPSAYWTTAVTNAARSCPRCYPARGRLVRRATRFQDTYSSDALREYGGPRSHPVGRFKAPVFHALGYSSENWRQLEVDLRTQHLSRDVTLEDQTRMGRNTRSALSWLGHRGARRTW